MGQELFLTVNIDESITDLESLTRDINNINQVEEAEEKQSSGIGTALVIAIISRLVVELIKQSPKAIKKLKKLIQKILEKRKKYSKSTGNTNLILHYEVHRLTFTLGMDDENDQQLEKLRKYISS